MEIDRTKFREAIYTAKLMAFITWSPDPGKRAKLERLREVMNEAQQLCDEIIGEEG